MRNGIVTARVEFTVAYDDRYERDQYFQWKQVANAAFVKPYWVEAYSSTGDTEHRFMAERLSKTWTPRQVDETADEISRKIQRLKGSYGAMFEVIRLRVAYRAADADQFGADSYRYREYSVSLGVPDNQQKLVKEICSANKFVGWINLDNAGRGGTECRLMKRTVADGYVYKARLFASVSELLTGVYKPTIEDWVVVRDEAVAFESEEIAIT